MKLPVDGTPILPADIEAPEEQRLRYVSQPRLYAIPPEQKPAEGDFEGLYLCERHVAMPNPGSPQHIGEYTVSIEAPVKMSGEISTAAQKLTAMAEDLDKFWVYACGEPLLPVTINMSFDVTPKGWQSNMEILRDYFLTNCHQIFAVVQMKGSGHWIAMPHYPLRPALEARHNYLKSDPIIQALADLHYSALKLPHGEGRLFSLARALELARKILPGNDDASKEKTIGLAPGRLKRSLHWLFDVGNNRFNTRHVVRGKSQAPALNPHMTGQELIDYQHDSDLILRILVCKQLQVRVVPDLQPANPQNSTTPANQSKPLFQ